MNTSRAAQGTQIVALGLGAVVFLLLLTIACIVYVAAWLPYQRTAKVTATLSQIGAADSDMINGRIVDLKLDHRSRIRDLAFLQQMPELKRLSLRYTEISDDDLREFRAAPQLEELELGMAFHDTGLDLVEYLHGEWMGMDLTTPEGMQMLREEVLPTKSVVLRNAEITGAGMKHVAALNSLRRLSLQNTAVGNAGLAYLARMPYLEELDLRLTLVNDDGIRQLKDFPSLQVLDVGNNRYISDACLADVAKISTLVELRPPYRLSNEALQRLHDLKGLRVLDLRDSRFSDEALTALREQLPACKILLKEKDSQLTESIAKEKE